jgi:hypothetical protein
LRNILQTLLCLLLIVPAARAHVGSKDVFETIDAGPYKLFVTIRPPLVIPGVADVEVRVSGAAVTAMQITPTPLTGEASKHPPTADTMAVSKVDPAFFTGSVWIMAPGSWQVRFTFDGAAGPQTASIPVPAVPLATLKMQRGMGWALGLMGLFLVASMTGLVGAAVRESRLAPGVIADAKRRRWGYAAMACALILLSTIVWLGGTWWDRNAVAYASNIYQPMKATASLNGDVLDLQLAGIAPRKEKERLPVDRPKNDLLPDHGKLIHLYAIREPEMDAAFHLHPELVAPGDFRIALPAMPPGTYRLFGDIVHKSGFPETVVTTLTIPAGLPAAHLGPDDAEATPAPLSAGAMGTTYKLPDGYSMVWDAPASLTANTAEVFRFRLLGPDGQPANGMEPYLGMAGHAAFVKTDGTVFAHTHPDGSAAMPAMDIANGTMDAMAGMSPAPVGPEVGFPYGFPSPGRYRIFVQMKHSGTVETGVFDALVK